MKKLILLVAIFIILPNCVSKQRESELQAEIKRLETELDMCINGAEKLYSKINLAFEDNRYNDVKVLFAEMKERHPESELFTESENLYNSVIHKEEELRKKQELERKKERERNLAAVKKLRKKFDDVSGITWYKNPYYVHYDNSNLTSLYIGKNDNNTWLRLRMSYEGEDWIFFEHAYLSYEGNTFEIYFNEYEDKESNNDGGQVWEWIDVSVSSDLEKFLRDFSQSSEGKMRLSGKYTRTRRLSWNERQGLRDVLAAYDILKYRQN